ncbi:MAG: isoamylase early set domain-containing protein [Candidatus Methylomirabilota bacterium]
MPKARFLFRCNEARVGVALLGDFNQWNPSSTPMRQIPDGTWWAEITLPPGQHEYKFLVDGREWRNDPDAPRVPNVWGSENSVVDVPSA